MRERIESLKLLLKDRHNERNSLRRELKAAQDQIESLRQTPAATASSPNLDRAEDQLLDSEDLPQAKQPVRLPEFPRRFEDVLARLPPATARSCLSMTGRLAAGEDSAFAGVKRLKALRDVYRQRIGEHYRLLFRMHPGRIEFVDLIHRRDLERRIKSLL
jgi:mRNA-degrading endonuclease RelE of RelBE toxin-antitoxin system